jgi:hypothetical protein
MLSQIRGEVLASMTRRELLSRGGVALSSLALTSLLQAETVRAAKLRTDPLAAQRPHFPARAKNVIHLHMVGAPSQLELFDNKPELKRHHGNLVPEHLIEGQRFAFLRGHPRLLGSPVSFERCGESGMEMSELLPHLKRHADDIAVVRTLRTEEFNHGPAQLFFQTGLGNFGRPSLGSWVTYGLGSENNELPAFVVLVTGSTAGAGNSLWGSGFLPTEHQGVEFRRKGEPVLFLSDPAGVRRVDRRRMLDVLQELNQRQLHSLGDPSIAARIAQYEKAFRMQVSVPELADLGAESPEIHELYGTKPGESSFANNCLLARRLIERGVRFVQLFDSGWDHHDNIAKNMRRKCRQLDQPVAALLQDLKSRGLLDETLVVWGGEFGRTPMLQGKLSAGAGRDHHKDAYSVWLAGGGVRGGTTYGKTDDLGYFAAENSMHINDLHATILHLLGMDHEKLTHRFQGRDFRLTDVAGQVPRELLA